MKKKRTKKERIDDLLHELSIINSNMGTDSTELEHKLAKIDKEVIVKKIRDIDEEFYNSVFNL